MASSSERLVEVAKLDSKVVAQRAKGRRYAE